MQLLVDCGIAQELTGKRRGRVFAYGKYLNILNEGIDEPAGAGPQCSGASWARHKGGVSARWLSTRVRASSCAA